jgi:D-ribose pyranase
MPSWCAMIQQGILNPRVLELLARIRHTNCLVIADWAFPYWPEVETVDISLTRDIPKIQDVLSLLQSNFKVGRILQAEEFLGTNPKQVVDSYDRSFAAFTTASVERLPHVDFKKLVPGCIGLIRTGDTTLYGNVILESV